jgi:hypothetical protein
MTAVLDCGRMRNHLYRTKRGERKTRKPCEIRRLHPEPSGSSVGAPSTVCTRSQCYLSFQRHTSQYTYLNIHITTHANSDPIQCSGPKGTCQIFQTQRDLTTSRLHVDLILHHRGENCQLSVFDVSLSRVDVLTPSGICTNRISSRYTRS